MATVLAIGAGPRIFLVELPGRRSSSVAWDPQLERAAERRATFGPNDLPEDLVARLEKLPAGTRILASGPSLRDRLKARTGRDVGAAELRALREARAILPEPEAPVERAFARALARRSLERVLRAPEEVLITLAREEERVERARGREERAAEAFLLVPGSPLERYRSDWESTRATLVQHHARLVATLESEARSVLPNLSAVVGPRVAARLLAAAGSLPTLGRMSAPRLQLLGSRRRPSPERGPRYGVLYRADRMPEVPPGRRGAYARSLAALAAIAVRADATTRRDISGPLVARRDRRVSALARRHA